MRVTLSLDEVVELIDAAQGALPYLWRGSHVGHREEHIRLRLIKAIETVSGNLFKRVAGDLFQEAE